MSNFKFSRRSISRMDGVDPEIIMIFLEAIKISPIDFGIPGDGGVRTAERQNAMFKDPNIKTNCDGYKDISYHQILEGQIYSDALDYYAYINGAASWDHIHLAIIAGVLISTAKRLKREGKISIEIEWGGTFGSNSFHGFDYPHIQKIRDL